MSGIFNSTNRPRVYIEPYWGCQKCHPRPFSERKWRVTYPGGYGSWQVTGCASYIAPTEFDTWADAMKAANAYQPPRMYNYYLTGNPTHGFFTG